MSAKKYAKTRAEADTERWFVMIDNHCGDVSDTLDEDLTGNVRRVSDWELVTAVDRFNGHIQPIMPSDGSRLPELAPTAYPRSYWALLYVWRCRIVTVGGAE
jgi:hypothetical protein